MPKLLVKLVVFAAASLLLLVLLIEFAPRKWLAGQLENPLGHLINANVQLEAVDLHILTRYPSLSVTGALVNEENPDDQSASLKLNSALVSISLVDLLKGELRVETLALSDGEVNLAIDGMGNSNWDYLIADSPDSNIPTNQVDPDQRNTELYHIQQLLIENVLINVSDARRELDMQLDLSAKGSTAAATTVQAKGTLNKLPTDFRFRIEPLAHLLKPEKPSTIDALAEVGSTKVAIAGSIASLTSLEGVALEISASAPDLGDVQNMTGVDLPVLPALSITGDLSVDEDQWVFRRFDGKMGNSDLQGDIRVNPATSPPTLYANVISTSLDLDDLAGLLGGRPDPSETVITSTPVKPSRSSTPSTRVLTDEPIALAALASFFNGAIEYRADEIRSPVWPLEAMDTRIEISGNTVTAAPVRIRLAGGEVAGSLTMDTQPDIPVSEVELRVKNLKLNSLLNAVGIDNESVGILGGRIKYWLEGDSIATMAANADGGLFLLMTEGQLDTLLIELAGVDLVESVATLIDPRDTSTVIDCAYLDLQTKGGVSDIATLVLDTADTVFLGDGSIDSNNESIDVTLEAHPKDISLLGAQTAAHITGAWSDPTVRPGQTLYARAAAAALLASVA